MKLRFLAILFGGFFASNFLGLDLVEAREPQSEQGNSKKIVRLATLDWQPYIGKKLKDNGPIFQIVKAAFSRVGFEVEVKFYPWARTMRLAESGQVDGYFPEYFNKDLNKNFVFSNSYSGGPVGFIKLSGKKFNFKTSENMKDFKELEGLKIGVVRGYTNTEEFDSAKNLIKEEVVDDISNIKKLYAGRLDLVFIDPNVSKFLIRTELKNKFEDAEKRIEFMSPPLEIKKLYTCFSKKSPDYKRNLEAFNKGLKLITEDGTLNRILSQFHFENGIWVEP